MIKAIFMDWYTYLRKNTCMKNKPSCLVETEEFQLVSQFYFCPCVHLEHITSITVHVTLDRLGPLSGPSYGENKALLMVRTSLLLNCCYLFTTRF